MYAIVEIAGQQFKVAKDQKVFVNRLATDEGEKVEFDQVLLVGDGDNITLGAPAIDRALVGAKVVRHLKGDKVIVFKKKRRKGYRVKKGHRQYLSEIVIESIAASGSKKSKKEAPKKAAPKKEEAAKVKPATEKKEAPKKTEAKKAAPKKSGKADDLKKIEGVGPKAMEAMVNAGIDTFAKVAKTSPEKLSEILTEASSRLAHLVTETWPEQAQLAADGKWEELEALQDKLDGGRK